jgi:outer membrane putative beta-barrel porin/alpha-amylase
LAHYFLLEGKIMRFRIARGRGRSFLLGLVFLPLFVSTANAQGPAPETAPPLFPGGGLVSYNSIFTTRALTPGAHGSIPATARPTFSHEGDFNFTWGFYRDFDLTVLVPVVTNHFDAGGDSRIAARGTGVGDAMVLVKYRFYRRDSKRGTTQASVTLGPKAPTGRTDLADMSGKRLPASLQPGSGSTDFFAAANWTYTGLFNLRRLVADEDFHSLLRSQGTQKTRLGSDLESRFWLSYRPYESKNGAREWFIGPAVTWLQSQDERIAAVTQSGSGGDVLLAGITTYVGVRPGMHVWLGMDWDVAHSAGAMFMPVHRHISLGITRQFRLHLK